MPRGPPKQDLYESFQWIAPFFQQWAAMIVEDRAMVARAVVRKRISLSLLLLTFM
jgi:hypothetical protein